jgi:hypothetical protein
MFPIYIGSDQPDQEAVYSVVRNMGGVGIMVTDRRAESFTPNDSCAAFHLRPEELPRFLDVFEQAYQSTRTMPLWATSTSSSST